MIIIVVICALLTICNATNQRLIGGELAPWGEFKYMASIRSRSNTPICGAAIITSKTLLTSASCKILNEAYLMAVVGTKSIISRDVQRFRIDSFIQHEDYNPETFQNDIAVVILAKEINLSDSLVEVVQLPSSSPLDNESVISSGWGLTAGTSGTIPFDLHWLEMFVLNKDKCSVLSDASMDLTGRICTFVEDKGTCFGDNGNPLVNNKQELVGIASNAIQCGLGKPDYFTDVFFYKDFIVRYMI